MTWPPLRLIRSLALAGLVGPALGAVEAGSGEVAIKREDCARLVKHAPAPDVAFQPGVDVEGRPFVPADLAPAYQVELPETIRVPITVLLQDRFGIPADSALYHAEAEIGTAEVSLDGERVLFAGVELTDPEIRALAAACQEILRGP